MKRFFSILPNVALLTIAAALFLYGFHRLVVYGAAGGIGDGLRSIGIGASLVVFASIIDFKGKQEMKATNPGFDVLIKLASLAVHITEYFDNIPGGAASAYDAAPFDVAAMRQSLDDADVIAWLQSMDKLALLPKKRSSPPYPPPAPAKKG
jgi:hypothetical protein